VADNKRHSRVRLLFYGGVLFFTVAVVILLSAVPALRARLYGRTHIFKNAMSGEAPPEITPVGMNDIPYPEEFLRPRSGATVSFQPVEPIQKRLVITQSGVQSITPPMLLETEASGRIPETGREDNDPDSPRFLQGEIEREAYEKTLDANEKLASMVKEAEPGFSLKSWGAARRDGGIYWVRLIFQNASGADVEYIWQTDISSGKTSPLNFNARNF
jgi:hypothetical protein